VPPGLDVDEAVVGVGRVGEHAAEFEVGDEFLHGVEVGLDRLQRGFVILLARHLEQVAGVGQRHADAGQRADHGFEGFLLLAQGLGALRVVPELGVFEDLAQFGELFRFAVVVKDTSAVARRDH
jgi:hypothetical protein